jgi:pantoate--beta-alanine ligase
MTRKRMSSSPEIVKKTSELRKQVGTWRIAGERIALVPTMGALHEGHLSLVRLAKKQAKRVVVSVFVNPAQFAPGEDFETYPRDEEGDRKKLAELGVDLIYMPDSEAMYPPGFSTHVSVSGLSEGLCGRSRPHFFGGVATVVAKLLLRCLPDMAYFGEKDFQQLAVVRRMVADLSVPVDVVGCPTVREHDGLAMSSRNRSTWSAPSLRSSTRSWAIASMRQPSISCPLRSHAGVPPDTSRSAA